MDELVTIPVKPNSRFLKRAAGLLFVASFLTVAGCSTDGEEESAEYPTLSTVPSDSGAATAVAEAQEIQEGLRADRENARYTDEALRADTSLGTPLQTPEPKEEVDVAVEETKIEVVAPQETTTVTETVTTVTEEPTAEGAAIAATAATAATVASTSESSDEETTPVSSAENSEPAVVATSQTPSPVATTIVSSQGVERVFEEQLAASSATSVVGAENSKFDNASTADQSSSESSAVALQNPVEDGGRTITNYAASDGTTPVEIIFFQQGSNRIGRNDKQKLRKIAETQLRSGGVLKVVGHASSRTRELPLDEHMLVNLNASQRRATAVAQTFLDLGVAGDNMIVESVSDSVPLSVEAMPSEEAKNRRVEIFLLN
ncbi:OmpA family protein [Sneathiella marina]|uniref:OmpA family protein n=1 Tax=Sneathiella marina TaxID=2950108 RepID=A0ABY4VYM7_9PROT|nr:OmpA family protein [Sneathiella marina]USG60035.1 OmpA family protein [Sneathiella marina]